MNIEVTYTEQRIETDILQQKFEVSFNGVVLGSTSFGGRIYNEIPEGEIDGSNATFTSTYQFVPESVEVFLNGMKLQLLGDYNTSGTQTITLNTSPSAGETLLINYNRQS